MYGFSDFENEVIETLRGCLHSLMPSSAVPCRSHACQRDYGFLSPNALCLPSFLIFLELIHCLGLDSSHTPHSVNYTAKFRQKHILILGERRSGGEHAVQH